MHLPVRKATIGTMTDDKVKRRLTTVLCADVYGYSRLMEADEDARTKSFAQRARRIRRLTGLPAGRGGSGNSSDRATSSDA